LPRPQTPLQWIEEENYFFKMSKYQGWLIDHIERNPDFVRPERYSQRGARLPARSADRSLDQPADHAAQVGVPLPFDEKYVTYVWFDALLNYVSALGGPGDSALREVLAPRAARDAKDIVKPHAIYWPCMLKAAGIPLYRHLNVHGTGRWRPQDLEVDRNLVEALALKEKYGNDAFRYFVLREMVFASTPTSPKRIRHAAQRRPGERPRQPGLARDDADREPGAGRGARGGRSDRRGDDDRRRVGAGPRRGSRARWTSSPSIGR